MLTSSIAPMSRPRARAIARTTPVAALFVAGTLALATPPAQSATTATGATLAKPAAAAPAVSATDAAGHPSPDAFAVNLRLLSAVRREDAAAIAQALRDGASIDFRNRLGETPLLTLLKKNRPGS